MKHGDKLKSSADFVRVIDLLRFLPEFQDKVNSIRGKLKITPESVNKERLELLGEEKFRLLLSIEKAADELDHNLFLKITAPLEQQKGLYEEVKVWERKRFPTLDKEIGKLRLLEFGGIPISWTEAIKDYILYDRIQNTPLLMRNPLRQPVIKSNVEPETLEPYIEIRIFADTDISFLSKAKTLKDIQRALPTYKEINSTTSRTAFRRLLYYFLRKIKKLSHQETSPILESHGFEPIEYEYSSQEMTRLLDLLKPHNK